MANPTTQAAVAIEELQNARNYTSAALAVFDLAKAPVYSSKVIADQLFLLEGLPQSVREGIHAIIANMALARYLLETKVDELEIECERWTATLENIESEGK